MERGERRGDWGEGEDGEGSGGWDGEGGEGERDEMGEKGRGRSEDKRSISTPPTLLVTYP